MTVSMRWTRNIPAMAGIALCAFASGATAQEPAFTAADSGWVRIFNGTDFSGLYSRTYGASAQPVRPPAAPYEILYPGTDTAVIRVTTTTGSQQGNIGTDKTSYSHYRVRVEYRFDVANGNNNAGLTYHTDETAPRMQNNWPRSIESQMKQSETGSAFSIQQVAFTTRATGTGQGSGYSPTGNVVQGCEFGCNGRWYRGSPLVGSHPAWNRMEVVVRGADSALHIINDTTVMRLWNLRLVDNSGQTLAPVDSGGITLQAEGALINYRRWEIMEFPAETPMNAHHLHRLFLDSPESAVYFVEEPIRWRSIGAIPWVRIEQRRIGDEEWTLLADSLPNTGSYAVEPHANCASPACMLDFRISGPDYVAGDSTVGRVASSISGKSTRERTAPLYSVRGGFLTVEGLAGANRLTITDVAGRTVRVIPVSGRAARWDLTDAHGGKVPPGLYFFRVTGPVEAPSLSSVRGRVFVE